MVLGIDPVQEERTQREQRVIPVARSPQPVGPLVVWKQRDVVATQPHPEDAFTPMTRVPRCDVMNRGSMVVRERESNERAGCVVGRNAIQSPIEIWCGAH